MAKLENVQLDLETDYIFLARKRTYEIWLFIGVVGDDNGYQGRILERGELIDSGNVYTLAHEAIDNIMGMVQVPGVVLDWTIL